MNQDSIIFLISLLGLSLFAGQLVLKYLRRRRARGWPTVRGQVHSTALRYQSGGEPAGAWIASVNYDYIMSGETQVGVHERSFATKGRAETWVAAYAAHRSLKVRVDPERPATSVVLEGDRA
jgi:hypothetical protein